MNDDGPEEDSPENDIVIRDMLWKPPKLFPRSAPMILLVLTVGAATGYAGVSHLVTRYTLNQQARGRKLYAIGVTAAKASNYDDAIADFRAALTCDPANSQYQLSLARALRDSNVPRRLEEAESYLIALWQRTPQDAAVNLALARVAAHRGSIEDATRYYHNAMYGVWNADPDANRNRARVELIEFLLKKGARAQADSELIALATALPPDHEPHLQAAQLFQQAQDYPGALEQYEETLRLDPDNFAAMSGAGETAYRSGNYTVAARYLRAAVKANPEDTNAKRLLDLTDLVLASNPFHARISDVERNHRIIADFTQAETRLSQCAQQAGVNLNTTGNATVSPLPVLQARWLAAKPTLDHLRSPAETDLPDTIMDVVFQIEIQTAAICGAPQHPDQALDQALLMISNKREATAQ